MKPFKNSVLCFVFLKQLPVPQTWWDGLILSKKVRAHPSVAQICCVW